MATTRTSTPTLTLPALAPVYEKVGPLSETAVRVAAGLFLVPHGAQKLFGWFGGYGLEATGQFFEQNLGYANGYAAALAAGSVEFFGGLMLAVGLLTRISAGAATVLLLVAMGVHLPNGFFWNAGGYEYALMWAIVTAMYVAKGGGAYSVDRLIGREL